MSKVVTPELLGIKKNRVGTICIEMKLKGMRKPQDFTLYPVTKDSKSLTIQSGTRIAKVTLDGKGLMSRPHSNGAYFHHLGMDKLTPFAFNHSDWRQIVEYIGLTEGDGGCAVIKVDNSGAKSIFGLD